jgi:1-pyrroline-5-carboxylate dehydrogenase
VRDTDYVAWQCDQDAYACSGQKCSAQSILFAHRQVGCWAGAGWAGAAWDADADEAAADAAAGWDLESPEALSFQTTRS